MEKVKHIIVIGASAGGIAAVKQVVANLSGDIDAAVFVVLHLSRNSNAKNILAAFQKHTSLVCLVAEDETNIQRGHLYLAPADHHLMVNDEKILVNKGAHENRYRPSIDVLFRSAAVHSGNRTIGIILSGMLDDGTSGMSAIQKCGGTCIVQDPAEAEYGDMPKSVMNLIKVHYQATLMEIPVIVMQLLSQPPDAQQEIPRELMIEAELTKKMMSDVNRLKEIADRTDLICPECGGGLSAVKNDPAHRYRCYTGHVYTERLLYDEQFEGLEQSLWVSLRMLEERRNLLMLMSRHSQEAGNSDLANANEDRSKDIERHIGQLKKLLFSLSEDLGRPPAIA